MAGLERLHRGLQAQGLRVIGVSIDEDINLAREYVRQSGISFPVRSDPKGSVLTPILGTPVIPASLLISRDTLVRRLVLGERLWDQGEPLIWIRELFAQ